MKRVTTVAWKQLESFMQFTELRFVAESKKKKNEVLVKFYWNNNKVFRMEKCVTVSPFKRLVQTNVKL